MNSDLLVKRVEERIRDWSVVVEDSLETESSFVAFGRRGTQPVVLKVMRQPGDEWRSGEVLGALGGKGVVRVYEFVEGAVLLERLNPGTPLATLSLKGRDEEATEVIAGVIEQMSCPQGQPKGLATAEEWGQGFERYLASGDNQIPKWLVEQGRRLYEELCASQNGVRLLHGDLHHYNILFDYDRGWLTIDPKGVIGEMEYEVGASLRNPYEKPELFTSPETIKRRVDLYETRLKLDANRALAWGFAQAVLSAIWSVEDGFAVDANNGSVKLAGVIRHIL
jgi:streptomycin 6-kinase